MTNFYIDNSLTADLGDGTTFALRRKNVDAVTATQLSPGDFLKVRRSKRSSGASWTWPATGGRTVTAPAGTAKLIDALTATTGWVAASANVTLSAQTAIPTIGGNNLGITLASAFITGKAAYKAVTVDLSTYTDVCIYVQTTSANGINYAVLDLCSDATGDTPVVSISLIPQGAVVAGTVYRICYRNGSALPSNIQSIAIRYTSDPGAIGLNIHCLFATKTVDNGGASLFDAITPNSGTQMSSFIGLNDGRLYAIAGITADDTYVLGTNGGFNSRNDNAGRGYGGATGGALTTYVWEGLPVDVSTAGTKQQPSEASTAASRSTLEGGYDTTAMTTREAFTMWSDVRGNVASINGQAYWIYKHIVVNGWQFYMASNSGFAMQWENSGFLFNGSQPHTGNPATGVSFDTILYVGATQFVMNPNANSLLCKFTNICVSSMSSVEGNIAIYGGGSVMTNVISENGAFGVATYNAGPIDNQPAVHNLITVRNGASLRTASNFSGTVIIKNATLNEATEFSAAALGGRFYVEDLDGVAGNHKIFDSVGTATRQTSVVNGSEPDALLVNPTNSTLANVFPFIPTRFIWKLTGGVANTLTVAARRDNTELILGIRYCPCQAASTEGGLTSTVEDLITASANTWEDLSITLTPSVNCIVGIELLAYGGTTRSGYFGKFRVS